LLSAGIGKDSLSTSQSRDGSSAGAEAGSSKSSKIGIVVGAIFDVLHNSKAY